MSNGNISTFLLYSGLLKRRSYLQVLVFSARTWSKDNLIAWLANLSQLNAFSRNYFRKKLHLRCLAVLWIRFSIVNFEVMK